MARTRTIWSQSGKNWSGDESIFLMHSPSRLLEMIHVSFES
jgi:hypothetical protein